MLYYRKLLNSFHLLGEKSTEAKMGVFFMTKTTQLMSAISILLVEDNPISSKIQSKMLEHEGCYVKRITNGLDAYECVKKQKFDAVIMDINMPVIDGYEATKMIRDWEKKQSYKPMPIIALSACSSPDKEVYLSKGIDFFIEKPLDKHSINIIFGLINKNSATDNT